MIANGTLREAVFVPTLGPSVAYLVSGLLLSAVIVGVAYAALPWWRARRSAELWAVGFGWLALTLVFEFSFGLWQGKSWPVLLQAYSFKAGNIWPIVLGVTASAPSIAARLSAWRGKS